MSTSQSSVKGMYDEAAGKIKQGVGEAINNDNLANEGAAQQIKGHAEQAWGSVKEAATDTKERNQPIAEKNAHDIREKITSTAQNVKEHIQAEADKFRNHDKHAA